MKPISLRVACFLGCFGLCVASLMAAQPPGRTVFAETPPVDPQVRQAMQDRNYAEARKAIDAAAKSKDAPQDYLAHLKAWSLLLEKQYRPAVAAYEQFQKQFPQSPWLRQARFAKAMALARLGDFQNAESIYRAEADYLLSPDRRQQLADSYLEFANSYFKPPEQRKPDYATSLELFSKGLQMGLKPDKRMEVELLIAQCHQNMDKTADAAKAYAKFIADHPAGPLDIEARFRLGECRLAEKNYREARRVWQDLLAKYPDSKSPRIADAAFLLAQTWNVPLPGTNEELSLGVASLAAFLERFPSHNLCGEAHLAMARSYRHRERYDAAVAILDRFIKDHRYRDRKEVAKAWNLLGQTYQMQEKFSEALATWREFLARFPVQEAATEVQEEIVDTEYLMGLGEYKAKRFESAFTLLNEFMTKYPLDDRNPGVMYLFGQMKHEQKKWDAAIAEWRRLVSKHPRSDAASHAQLMIVRTLEEELGKLDEALDAYRRLTDGRSADAARQAAARLTAKSMTVATQRVFRSDETPKIQLTTRNIDTVTVRAYKVDLETYFRKMRTATGAEGLDISLIDPDRVFEFKVPGYAKYQPLDSEIQTPLPDGAKAGVMIVTVSSQTLEAATLVIQSDLDILAKISDNEVFVFAEDMRSGRPRPGVRLLVSDGGSLFAEMVTGADGVCQKPLGERGKAGALRVLAMVDGHVASNEVRLQGATASRRIAEKGYIDTDRPAYQAGQKVCVRGCVRRWIGDVYAIETGRKHAVDVVDARNRLVGRNEVVLSPLGTFHTEFTLPANCQHGPYRILARNDAGHIYTGGFQVQRYRQESIRLTVETPKTVYYRGEPIQGILRAGYDYGAPVAGKEVRYQLANEAVNTAKTDARGEIRFELPTRDFDEAQMVRFEASLPEQGVRIGKHFLLATQGFTIDVSTVRPVFVAGETFEATVKTRDAEGKPLGESLSLKVFQLVAVRGKVGQRLVQERTLATTAADGTARPTLKIAQGGRYLLRVEGTDAFKNPIFNQVAIDISADEDRQRLMILANQHTFKVGDTAQVDILWRENPALGLVTFQGAGVLGYTFIPLNKGVNRLAIPIGAKLAPNFELAVAVMTDGRPTAALSLPAATDSPRDVKGLGGPAAKPAAAGAALSATALPPPKTPANDQPAQRPVPRFQQASSPFVVQRDLRVKIACQRKGGVSGRIRPGDTVDISIATTDPQGKPVAADVSLAMVQQSFLERFAASATPFQQAFYEGARTPAIRTASSITFACRPETRPINPRLLAERDRQELAEEEEVSRREPLQKPVAPTATPTPTVSGSMADFSSLIDLIAGTMEPKDRQDARRFQRAGKPSRSADAAESAALGGMAKNSRGVEGAGPTEAASSAQARDQMPDTSQADRMTALPGRETGYWNPAVMTGADGMATVTVTLPEESTVWTIVAKGITADTLVGQATETFTARSDFFGELKLPAAFTEGDETEVGVIVHNDLVDKGPVEVALKTTLAGRSVEQKRTIDAKAKGIYELAFATSLRPAEKPLDASNAPTSLQDAALFELVVTAGQTRDTLRRSVPLLPFGMSVVQTASGSAVSDTTAWVEPPKDMVLQSPSLEIVVGPTVEQSLLDIVAPSIERPWRRTETCRGASDVETAASDLMASLALQKLVGVSRDAGGPHAPLLESRISTSLGLLVLAQKDDGGWGWTDAGPSDPNSSARAFWAVSLARRAGYSVANATIGRAVDYLRKQLAAASNADYAGKAILLHALAVAGEGDFALANHLYRERKSLSPTAIAYLALALAHIDRKTMAREILELLVQPPSTVLADLAAQPSRVPSADRGSVEIRALEALGWQQIAPKSPKAQGAVDWLLAHRIDHRWTPDKATGPASLALCAWFAENRFQDEHYKLAVSVNGFPVAELDVDKAALTRVVRVPASCLVAGKQRINFQLTGRGRYTYQCVLGGFVAADKLKSTTTDWEVHRLSEPSAVEFDGRAVARGFDVVDGAVNVFHNPMTQLPVARRGQVTLELRRKSGAASQSDARRESLVIREPVPAGALVVEKSIRGGFDRVEIVPGAILFYIGGERALEPILYQLDGYLPGRYRVGPTIVGDAYRPDRFAVASPTLLCVLPLGSVGGDTVRYTPRELFELGKLLKDKGDAKAAVQRLTELIDRWSLKGEVYRSAVEMLLDLHLEVGPAAKVVQYFEIVKEKWPEQEIPFAKAVKVGAAYHEIGEFERSYLVFRATVEASFTRESGVAGFLDSQGEFLRSVEVMGRLLHEYPPESYVAEADFALAQRVYAKAPEAAADPKLRGEKINRVVLIRRAGRMLDGFLTTYPSDPAADQAAFAAANALLELKNYDEAAAAAARYAARFPKSDLLDAYWYMIGYCNFATGRHQAAIQMCRKVADARHTDPASGRLVESPNKWRAIYILGQIHHSLGQAADAIREYRRVEDKFPDARLSIVHFLRKAIELPEVTTVKPGAAAELELKFRNIAACDVAVYRIDLMKFSLYRGDLSGITQINLAGIRPLYSASVPLGDGKDYRDRAHKVPLPLKQEGAYLVVCRGGDLYGSGLVLVTSLAVEVQYDARSGQVRSMVKDTTTDRYLTGVDVKVIGGRDNGFVAGATDLRGVFTADGIQGPATVVAQAGPGRYAFFRSSTAELSSPSPQRGLVAPPQPGSNQPSDGDDPFAGVAPPQPDSNQPSDGEEPFAAVAPPQRSASGLPVATARKPTESTKPSRKTRTVKIEPTPAEPIDMGGRGVAESEKKIREALDSPTHCNYIETPLPEVIDGLKKYHNIEMLLDTKALADAGTSDDARITLRLKGVTLRSALSRMLHDLELTYLIQDEVLLITTRAEAELRLSTVTYPVADLVSPPGAGSEEGEADFASLIDALTGSIQPLTWQDAGGVATIKDLYNKGTAVLVVSQTAEAHHEIGVLLAELRRQGGKTAVAAQSAKLDAGADSSADSSAAASATPARPAAQRSGGGGKRGFGGDRAMGNMGGMGMGGMGGMGGMVSKKSGGMGGMGGMVSKKSGGMGGMGGGAPPQRSQQASADTDLLEGLQSANRQFQGQQVERLKKRYQGGMGGMGGGMGGMSAGSMNQSK